MSSRPGDGMAEQLLDTNTPELPAEPLEAPCAHPEPPGARPENHRTIEEIWPAHTCGKSETAAAISACACGAAVGMLVLYGLCNLE